MATNKEMQVEFQYFGEVWIFFKKYFHVRPDDDYWDALTAEAGQLL